MDRVIKFRVFDGQTETMIYDVLPISNRVCIKLLSDGKYGEIWGEFDNDYMQFTGLLGSNKKPIYEGDILERYSGLVAKGDNPWVCSVVVWNKYKWDGINGYPSAKIIGNIHESPELLQQGKASK